MEKLREEVYLTIEVEKLLNNKENINFDFWGKKMQKFGVEK